MVVITSSGSEELLGYDKLIIATGASPIRPPIDGLDMLGQQDGVHFLHSMDDTLAIANGIRDNIPGTAIIVGGGYIGLEMADALTLRGLAVTQIEQLPEVLPTVDPDLGASVHATLSDHGVHVLIHTKVRRVRPAASGESGRLSIDAIANDEHTVVRSADLVLVVVGVKPETELAATAGAKLGAKAAIAVDREMRTNLPNIFAAGDCAVTYHSLLGEAYLPLGTTAHKQGRIAGENAVGGSRQFAGSLGTQVVKIFDHVAARTGLRDHEAHSAGFDPLTVGSEADDHKAYYPGSQQVRMRYTADRSSNRLLGLQLYGHLNTEIAKRIDTAATAIHNEMTIDAVSDLDLSYTPPLGTPWDALQTGAQAWRRSEIASEHYR